MTKDIATIRQNFMDFVYSSGGLFLTGYKEDVDCTEAVREFNQALSRLETALSSPPAIDDLGELLKRVPEGITYRNLQYSNASEKWIYTLEYSTGMGWQGQGDTPAEAVRKAMEKMEEGE